MVDPITMGGVLAAFLLSGLLIISAGVFGYYYVYEGLGGMILAEIVMFVVLAFIFDPYQFKRRSLGSLQVLRWSGYLA